MQVNVTWSQTVNNAFPVNSSVAEYAIQVPGANLSYNGDPDGTIGTMSGAGRAASGARPGALSQVMGTKLTTRKTGLLSVMTGESSEC